MIRMTVTVVLVYSLCWLPFNVLMVLHDLLRDVPGFHLAWAGCHWLAMSHTVFNPLILYWLNTTFRVTVLKMLYRWVPRCCRGCLDTKLDEVCPQYWQRSTTCTTSCGLHNCSLHHSSHRHHHRRTNSATTKFSTKRSFNGRHCEEVSEATCVPLTTLQPCLPTLQSSIAQQRHKSNNWTHLKSLSNSLQLQSRQLCTVAKSEQYLRSSTEGKQDQLEAGTQTEPSLQASIDAHAFGGSGQLYSQLVNSDLKNKKSSKFGCRDLSNKRSWYSEYKSVNSYKREKKDHDHKEFCSDNIYQLRGELEVSFPEVISKSGEKSRMCSDFNASSKRNYLSPFSNLVYGKETKGISHSTHLEHLANKNKFIITENKAALAHTSDSGINVRAISKSDTNLSLGLSTRGVVDSRATKENTEPAFPEQKVTQATESPKIISFAISYPRTSLPDSSSLQKSNLTQKNCTAQHDFSPKSSPYLRPSTRLNMPQDSDSNLGSTGNDFLENFESDPAPSTVKVHRNSSQETAATDHDEDDWSESEIILPDSMYSRFGKAANDRGCRV
ncbi:G protein-coupled receptor rhodopsin-like [Trinorchestia longiramus]|nr:G protein-coupled receptor rhodopsin-like [Trinorchestia longiramus]